jgi:hypothetical protein
MNDKTIWRFASNDKMTPLRGHDEMTGLTAPSCGRSVITSLSAQRKVILSSTQGVQRV